MANVDFFSAFEYAWGENGAIDTWIDTQYKLGWASIGSVPPSVEQFNAVHHIADLKANWLYGQLKTAATSKGVTLAAEDLSALVQILAATAPDASTTKKGLIEIATEAEAKALANALLAITPATLGAVLAEFRSGIPGATFAELDAATSDQGPAICTDMGGYLYKWVETAYFSGYRNVRIGELPDSFATINNAWWMAATGGVWNEADPKQRRLIAWFREQGQVMAAIDWAPRWGRIADLGGGDWKAVDLQDVFKRYAGTDADTANARLPGSQQKGSVLIRDNDTSLSITSFLGSGTTPAGKFGWDALQSDAEYGGFSNLGASSAPVVTFTPDAQYLGVARPQNTAVGAYVLV